MLPSQVMKLGDSIDVRCANIAIGYEQYLHRKAQGNIKDKSDHGLSQEQLKEMIAKAKSRGKN